VPAIGLRPSAALGIPCLQPAKGDFAFPPACLLVMDRQLPISSMGGAKPAERRPAALTGHCPTWAQAAPLLPFEPQQPYCVDHAPHAILDFAFETTRVASILSELLRLVEPDCAAEFGDLQRCAERGAWGGHVFFE
jgi:hypothetical protein